MAGLERDAADAVRSLASARTPDEGAAERAWVLMQQRLLEGPPPIDIGAASANTAARARWIAIGISVAALLVLAVGIASWSAGWLAGIDARAPYEAPYSTALPDPSEGDVDVRERSTAGASERSAVAPTPEPVEAPVPAPPVSTPPAPAPKSSKGDRRAEPEPEPNASASASASATKTTTLEAEMRLLGRANAALRSGDPAAALAVLDEHARDFARGQLAPEREYKRALALCELGRSAKARAVADAFVKAHPRSPLRTKAQTVCRGEDPR